MLLSFIHINWDDEGQRVTSIKDGC